MEQQYSILMERREIWKYKKILKGSIIVGTE